MTTKPLRAALLLVILAAASCVPAPAHAADTYLYTGAWSRHLVDGDYNEVHQAYGIQSGPYSASYFVNSYGREGAFAGYTFRKQRGDVELGLLVGGVYAYRGCYRDSGSKTLCPLVVPSVTYTRFRVQPQVALWGPAVVLAVRWKLF